MVGWGWGRNTDLVEVQVVMVAGSLPPSPPSLEGMGRIMDFRRVGLVVTGWP